METTRVKGGIGQTGRWLLFGSALLAIAIAVAFWQWG